MGLGGFMAKGDVDDLKTLESVVRAMAETSRELMCIFDSDYRYLYANPAYETVLGYTFEDLTQRLKMADIVHPDNYARPRLASAQKSHELRMKHKDGHWLWIEGAHYPMNLSGRPVTVAIGRDVTGRKEAETQYGGMLQLFDSIPDSTFMINRQWEYTFVNRAALEYIRREPAEIIGHTVWELFPAFEGTTFDGHLRRAMDATKPAVHEEHYPPTGRWMRANYFPTGDGVVVHATDITEYKNSQAAHSGLASIIAQRDESLSPETLAILNLMPDPMAVMDERLCYAYLNAAAKLVASRPQQEMLGKTPWEIDMALAPFERNYREAMQTHRRSSFVLHYTPGRRWFEVELIPTGRQLIAYTVDITKQKASQDAVSRLTDSLETALDTGWDRRNSRGHSHKPKA
jgi:PAS domain S-box-containing protein